MSCSWLCICSGGEYEWLMVDVIPHIELQQVFVGQGTLYSTFTTWIAQKYCGWAASLENGVLKNAVVPCGIAREGSEADNLSYSSW